MIDFMAFSEKKQLIPDVLNQDRKQYQRSWNGNKKMPATFSYIYWRSAQLCLTSEL